MPHYAAIRSFLSYHDGYYCEERLATRLNLPPEEIRRSLGRRTFAEISLGYRICQSCLEEKGVFARRKSA